MQKNNNDSITPLEFIQKYDEYTDDISVLSSPEYCEMRKARILFLSEKLLKKTEMAIEQVDLYKIKVKEKSKEVEYDDESKKLISEVQTEREKAEIGQSLIDTSSLRQLVSTLKDIKDIHLSLSDSGPDTDDEESGVIVISDVEEGGENQ